MYRCEEVLLPQAKPWLVRLAPFQISVRAGPKRWTVRDEILAVLAELMDERGEFRFRDLVARLNPDNDLRRRWAMEKALMRLCADEEPGSTLTRVGSGCCWVARS